MYGMCTKKYIQQGILGAVNKEEERGRGGKRERKRERAGRRGGGRKGEMKKERWERGEEGKGRGTAREKGGLKRIWSDLICSISNRHEKPLWACMI